MHHVDLVRILLKFSCNCVEGVGRGQAGDTNVRMIAPATPLATAGQRRTASPQNRIVPCEVALFLFTKVAWCMSMIRIAAPKRTTTATISITERRNVELERGHLSLSRTHPRIRCDLDVALIRKPRLGGRGFMLNLESILSTITSFCAGRS